MQKCFRFGAHKSGRISCSLCHDVLINALLLIYYWVFSSKEPVLYVVYGYIMTINVFWIDFFFNSWKNKLFLSDTWTPLLFQYATRASQHICSVDLKYLTRGPRAILKFLERELYKQWSCVSIHSRRSTWQGTDMGWENYPRVFVNLCESNLSDVIRHFDVNWRVRICTHFVTITGCVTNDVLFYDFGVALKQKCRL